MTLAAWLLALAGLLCTVGAAAAPAPEDFQAFVERIGDSVRAREFETLDQEADQLRRDKSRLPDGRWKLAVFFGAVGDALPDIVRAPRRRAAFETELAEYLKQHPDSMNAPILLSKLAQTIAWDARGHGLANTVTEQGWRTFNLSMRAAAALLEQHRVRLSKHPEWHAERLLIATYLGESDAMAVKIFEEGMRQEPAYLSLYFTMQLRLSRQWGGSDRALMAFINDVGRRSPAAAQEGLYARMVWFGAGYYTRIEFDPALDWPAMRKGMDAVVATYPAERNVQKMFFIACSHPDKAQAKKLLPLMKQQPLREILDINVPVFRLCVEWATDKLDEFVMRDPDTGQERLIR